MIKLLCVFVLVVGLSFAGCKRQGPLPASSAPSAPAVSIESLAGSAQPAAPPTDPAAPAPPLEAAAPVPGSDGKLPEPAAVYEAIQRYMAETQLTPNRLEDLTSKGYLKLPPPPPGKQYRYNPREAYIQVVDK
jgi:hypothetical protein